MSIKIPGNSLKLMALPRLPAWYGEQGLSVCLSVCPVIRPQPRQAECFAAERRTGRIYRSTAAAVRHPAAAAPQHGAQQQMRAVSR